jgi:hypothetical protein
MSVSTKTPVGAITVSDLTALHCEIGSENAPYPFAPTQQTTLTNLVSSGDVAVFREWVNAYVTADVWVAGRVIYAADDALDRRFLGYRDGASGYFAAQANDDDLVEVFRIRPDDIGPTMADAIGLTGAGRRERIVVPGYVGRLGADGACDDFDDEDRFEVSARAPGHFSDAPTGVDDEDVSFIATVQSRWQPARRWGLDWTRHALAVVHLDGDGDYIYTGDFSHAVPVTGAAMCDRINQMIADDLRHRRRGG